jgi:hypothetical protein
MERRSFLAATAATVAGLLGMATPPRRVVHKLVKFYPNKPWCEQGWECVRMFELRKGDTFILDGDCDKIYLAATEPHYVGGDAICEIQGQTVENYSVEDHAAHAVKEG